MKNLILILLAFGLGVYVGKPAQITLQAPEVAPVQECPKVVQLAPSQPIASAPIVHQDAAPAAASQERQEEKRADEPKKEEAQAEPEAPKTQHVENKPDEDELPIAPEDVQQWAKNATKDMARGALRGENGIFGPNRFTFTREEYKHFEVLKAELTAANLVITEEGPLNVGKYVYYIIVGAKP